MWNGPIPSLSMGSGKMKSHMFKMLFCSSCLFGTEIRQINMLSKRLENRSEEYYIYHKAKVDLIWITGETKTIFYK